MGTVFERANIVPRAASRRNLVNLICLELVIATLVAKNCEQKAAIESRRNGAVTAAKTARKESASVHQVGRLR